MASSEAPLLLLLVVVAASLSCAAVHPSTSSSPSAAAVCAAGSRECLDPPDAAANVKNNLCKRCIPSPSSPPPIHTAVASTSTATTEPVPAGSASLPPASSSVQSPDDAATSPPPPPPQQQIMCLERVSADTYLGMAAHPDGSSRVFLWTQDGKIWLASVPAPGSRRTLRLDGAPLLDLTGRVVAVMGVALHPHFSTNCRLFVSYTDCNAAAAAGTQYQLVVAEFSAKGAYAKGPTRAEVRRIFTMGLPQPPHLGGGELQFRPAGGDGDGHLYLVVGNGGQPADSSQRRTMPPPGGKIVRFDVNQMTPADTAGTFATGLIDLDPRGCSFDSESPSHLFCAGVDEQQQEMVRLISMAGEGYQVVPVINHGPPAAGTPPSIVGGRVYRGSAVSWLIGRLLYMFRSAAWMADVAPEGGGAAGLVYDTARIPSIRCSGSSPVQCGSGAGEVHVHFVGEDNSKDVYLLTDDGVHRVVHPGQCVGPASSRRPPWLAWLLSVGGSAVALAIYLVWSKIFAAGGGGEQPATSADGGWFWFFCYLRCCIIWINNNGRDPGGLP